MWRTLRISGREYDVSFAITEGGAMGMRALRRSSLSSYPHPQKHFFFKLPSHPAGEFTLCANWVIVCWWSVTDDPAARSSAAMVQKMGNMLDTWVDTTSKSGQDVMGGHECVQCAVAWVRTDIIWAVAELLAFCSLLINDRMSRLAACFRRRVGVNVNYVYRWNNPLSFTGEDVLLRPLHCTFHPSFCTG